MKYIHLVIPGNEQVVPYCDILCAEKDLVVGHFPLAGGTPGEAIVVKTTRVPSCRYIDVRVPEKCGWSQLGRVRIHGTGDIAWVDVFTLLGERRIVVSQHAPGETEVYSVYDHDGNGWWVKSLSLTELFVLSVSLVPPE